MFDETRIALLERRTELLAERVEKLEDRIERDDAASRDAAPHAAPPRVWVSPVGPAPSRLAPELPAAHRPRATTSAAAAGGASQPGAHAPATLPSPRRAGIEDLVAGRVLAWAGGATVFVGLVLLFAVAISRGWIDEATRTLIGAIASAGLVVAGGWLRERLGRIDAASAAAAAGIGGLFACSVVATRAYDLVPVAAGLALALATGATAVALALRWDSHGMAALGIVGGLASPTLVGAPAGSETIAILFVATLAAAAICARRGWDWLALASFGVVTPQWLAGLSDAGQTTAGTIATLIGFGLLFAAAATGHDLRTRATAARVRPIVVLVLNALVLAAPGWALVDEQAGRDAANVWLATVAAAHLAAGLALVRARRSSLGAVVTILTAGVLAADAALILALDGLALVLVWSAMAVGFAAVARVVRRAGGASGAGRALLADSALAVAVGGHLMLASLHALLEEARPEAIAAGDGSTTAAVAVAAIAAAAFVAALLVDRKPEWRDLLQATGLGALGYLAAVVLDGAPLVVALAAAAVVLAEVSLRVPAAADDPRPLTVRAAAGAAALLGVALTHALVLEAPPVALVDGVGDLGGAALALGACAIAAGSTTLAAAALAPEARPWQVPLAAVVPLYLASVAVVTAAGAGDDAQMLLSALWGAVGVVALIVGLVRDVPALRTAALALVGAALVKVFLYDLATLDALARVASFLALGGLLLAGAFAWQRIRPPEPPPHG